MIRTEIHVCAGFVVVVMCDPDAGDVLELVLSPDEAREYVNGLGEAIMRVSKVGVLA